MTVEKIGQRKTVEISWDVEKVKGFKVDIKATRGSTVSTRDDLVNDGTATITFPKGFKGESHVTVTGSKGGTDEGTITV